MEPHAAGQRSAWNLLKGAEIVGAYGAALWALGWFPSLLAAPAPREPDTECADGTPSYSKSRQGACSGRGGVRRWLTGESER